MINRNIYTIFRSDRVVGIPGAPIGLTEVYSWGRNGHGQLGTADRTGKAYNEN